MDANNFSASALDSHAVARIEELTKIHGLDPVVEKVTALTTNERRALATLLHELQILSEKVGIDFEETRRMAISLAHVSHNPEVIPELLALSILRRMRVQLAAYAQHEVDENEPSTTWQDTQPISDPEMSVVG